MHAVTHKTVGQGQVFVFSAHRLKVILSRAGCERLQHVFNKCLKTVTVRKRISFSMTVVYNFKTFFEQMYTDIKTY